MADVPFYYHLNLVACQRQRQGYGAALLQPMLDRADEQGLPCYVESDGAGDFYRLLGFETKHRHDFGHGIVVEFMRRDPRAAVSKTLDAST